MQVKTAESITHMDRSFGSNDVSFCKILHGDVPLYYDISSVHLQLEFHLPCTLLENTCIYTQ